MKTRLLTLLAAVVLIGGALLASPVGATVLEQATAIRRSFYPFHIDANHSDSVLDADQDGTGSIANFSDGGTDEYTFDQSSATFVNQLNLTDDLKIGAATPDTTLNGGDANIAGTLEVDGASRFDGALDINAALTGAANLEHFGIPTWLSTNITYGAAAGSTTAVATIGAGEVWIVHDIRVEVTTNFDATGDDATLVIGDGNDADGFCVLADAELQAADTEGTGWTAGWQCQAAATRGAYIDGLGGFVYDEASEETIDAIVGEASGTTLSAGAATVHVLYTRIQ